MNISLLNASVPKEKFIFQKMSPQADYIIVKRIDDEQLYILKPGIGCLIALFDTINENTPIYIQGFTNILNQSIEDLALLYIKTNFHDVSCKIIDIRKY
jgi:hypothetical protein